MPKTDLRSSMTSQLNKAAKRDEAPAEHLDDAGKLTAFTGATSQRNAQTSAERKAASMLSGGYAYDLDEVVWMPVDIVHDNPYQPRTAGMGDVRQLEDLIESMNEHGQLQPVVVRPHPDAVLHPNEFQQAFGHRRKYAIKLGKANAGTGRPDAVNLIGHIPCLIRKGISDEAMLSRAIDENEVRDDVIAIDRARSNRVFREMVSNAMADEGLIKRMPGKDGKMQLARLASYREIEQRKGKKYRQFARVDVINDLPPEILKAFDEAGNWDFLKVAHGTALLILQDYPKDQKRLLNDAVKNSWSGAETAATAKERLAEIKSRDSQGTLEGTAEAVAIAEQRKADTERANADNRAALQAGTSHLSSVPPVATSNGPKFAVGDDVKWVGKDRWLTGKVSYVLTDGRVDVRGEDGIVLTLRASDLVRYNANTEAPKVEFSSRSVEVSTGGAPAKLAIGDWVKWDTNEGLRTGKIEEVRDDGSYGVRAMWGGKSTVAKFLAHELTLTRNYDSDVAASFAAGDCVIVKRNDEELQGTITSQGTLDPKTWIVEFGEKRGNAIIGEADIRLAEPIEEIAPEIELPSGALLIESLAGETRNEALIRKAQTFLDAAKNELEQVKDVDDQAREEIELAIDTCRNIMDVLKRLQPSGEKFISQL